MLGETVALAHSQRFRRIWQLVLAVLTVLTVVLLGGAYPDFTAARGSAVAFASAPPCGDTPPSATCIATEVVTVYNRYVTHGSKGGTYYHVQIYVPGGGYQTTTASYSEYYAMPPGAEVTAEVWRGRAVRLMTDAGGYTTDYYPPAVLGGWMITLVLIPAALAFGATALMFGLSAAGPDDLMRREVTGDAPPPRDAPAGLLAAVLAWKAGKAMAWGVVAAAAVLAFWAISITSGSAAPASAEQAPLVATAIAAGTAFVAYVLIYRRALRDATTGVYAAIPVTSETIIRGRSGPLGVRARYTLQDGATAKVSITRRWWRRVGVGSRLDAVVSPETGKIWRLLGVFDGTGNQIF